MIWLALYLSPAGLLLLFLLYAGCRRIGLRSLELLVMVVGMPCDVWNNYTWFRLLGWWPWDGQSWPDRTVTARITQRAKDGNRLALLLARFLNFCDPGHVAGVK